MAYAQYVKLNYDRSQSFLDNTKRLARQWAARKQQAGRGAHSVYRRAAPPPFIGPRWGAGGHPLERSVLEERKAIADNHARLRAMSRPRGAVPLPPAPPPAAPPAPPPKFATKPKPAAPPKSAKPAVVLPPPPNKAPSGAAASAATPAKPPRRGPPRTGRSVSVQGRGVRRQRGGCACQAQKKNVQRGGAQLQSSLIKLLPPGYVRPQTTHVYPAVCGRPWSSC